MPSVTSSIPNARTKRSPAWDRRSAARSRAAGHRLRPHLCTHRKRVNIGTLRAGQRGINEADDGTGLVSLLDHDLGEIDPEQKALHPLDNPFGARLSLIA
jgi:hypothetical protein